jgi:hypothetical protein
MAQALSQDHFFECNMLCAASLSITRIISSPQRDILPLQSISPDWYLEQVSPNTAPNDEPAV